MFPLLEIRSLPATPDPAPPVVLGMDEWPGGDVVHIGSNVYPDGAYPPGSPERSALIDPNESSWVAFKNGRSAVNVFPSGGTRGERGYVAALELPSAAVVPSAYVWAKWVDGYLFEEDEGEFGWAVSFHVRLGRSSFDVPLGSSTGNPHTRDLTTRLGPGHYRFGYEMSSWVGARLNIDVNETSEDQRGTWMVYHVEIPEFATAGGLWPLRQRQSLVTASWPLRQRQNAGHSGSWPLRQRQTGV